LVSASGPWPRPQDFASFNITVTDYNNNNTYVYSLMRLMND